MNRSKGIYIAKKAFDPSVTFSTTINQHPHFYQHEEPHHRHHGHLGHRRRGRRSVARAGHCVAHPERAQQHLGIRLARLSSSGEICRVPFGRFLPPSLLEMAPQSAPLRLAVTPSPFSVAERIWDIF